MEHSKIEQRTARGRILGATFALIYLLALAPPAYIAFSKLHDTVAFIPLSIWYMLLISAATIFATYGLWLVERRNGDLG